LTPVTEFLLPSPGEAQVGSKASKASGRNATSEPALKLRRQG
jgi:hypothetical protein